ncbi:hypothetical protein [Flavobacterium geliluteum]|uniref:Uncharacterized protein n=1 Tax=Flavobacterium geliluteum TaxID=2816120 RepID=A0A940XDV4_9FLAO|nr:hypothetical protein [Flavobacterium geliluteum]MBP4140121.1 hypothetical protein [Flavobacterium geliluteum]
MPMSNTTFEDYKIAVKNKYEEEKDGRYFTYLSAPTRAKLRDLCWEIFEKPNVHQDDLTVFNTFLGLPFSINTKNKFKEQKDKFRPIETFFKGETDPTNVDAVNLAAILLDFTPRPYAKFRTSNREDENKGINRFYNSELVVKKEQLLEVLSEVKEVKPARVNTPINLFISFKKKCCETLLKKSKGTIISVALIFCLISAVIYFAFFKKDCMQWSGDHYERVDCNLKVEGFVQLNSVEPFDESKFELKKINLSDTTTCFKNGEALIWYAKTANGVDFFNTHGRHPENDNPLRPVTQYILNKYGKH